MESFHRGGKILCIEIALYFGVQFYDSNIGLFSIALHIVIALNLFATFLYIGKWLLFCIASCIVIALSTVALLRS